MSRRKRGKKRRHSVGLKVVHSRRRRSGRARAGAIGGVLKNALPLLGYGAIAALATKMIYGYLMSAVDPATGLITAKAPSLSTGLMAAAGPFAIAYLLKRPAADLGAVLVGSGAVLAVDYLAPKIALNTATSNNVTLKRMVAGLSTPLSLGDDNDFYLGDFGSDFSIGNVGRSAYAIGGGVGVDFNY